MVAKLKALLFKSSVSTYLMFLRWVGILFIERCQTFGKNLVESLIENWIEVSVVMHLYSQLKVSFLENHSAKAHPVLEKKLVN